MYCNHCGTVLSDNISTCTNCGMKVNYTQTEVRKNTFALVGFILGLISFFLNFWGIVGTLAIVFSAIGIANLRKSNDNGKVFAIIGLFSGIFNVIYAIIVIFSLT